MPRIEPVEPGPPGPGHDPLDLHGVLGRRGHAHVPGVGEGDQGGEQARVREGRREEQQRRGERRGHIALEGRFEPRREGEIVGFGRRRRLRRLRLRRREPQRRLLEPSGEVELAPGLEVCEEGPPPKRPRISASESTSTPDRNRNPPPSLLPRLLLRRRRPSRRC